MSPKCEKRRLSCKVNYLAKHSLPKKRFLFFYKNKNFALQIFYVFISSVLLKNF